MTSNLPTPIGRQREVLALPPSGHIVVLGTAGSGKTTLAIHRAAFLADSDTDHMSAGELADGLEVTGASELRQWLGRLVELGLVVQTGRTRGTRYPVVPSLLRDAGLDQKTTLERIEPHRLRALIVEDVARYPDSTATEIRQRVGPEIPMRTFRRALEELVSLGSISATGRTRGRRYRPGEFGHGGETGQ